ncbi:ribosomal protein L22 [Periconia macrospinosa]|uniref:Ribosomal protein L22 n=1 Tax=Periconia macrospinosa TaxID=97972 RepID=A0A2V1DGN9_9PLEO|nr:ribosomal protein L22 [Periconia macrospinosa]
MSARIPSRRLGQPALAVFHPRTTTSYITSTFPHRSFSCALRLKAETPVKADTPSKPDPKTYDNLPKDHSDDPLSNPILETYLKNHLPSKEKRARIPPPNPPMGDLSATSIFQPEHENPKWHDSLSATQLEALKQQEEARNKAAKAKLERQLRANLTDPVPERRLRLERKLLVREVEKHGRITKAIKLARTEREFTYISQDLPTSTKKLTRLMHLIAGKTVEEALVQLRFSKKRIAIDVRKGLMLARDRAIVERGMGLGGQAAAQNSLGNEEPEDAINSEPHLADGASWVAPKGEGKLIQLKDGSRKRVHNDTEIYIDQAWVGSGPSGYSLEYRARGRVNKLTHRSASFSVLLKEEKTRIRISDELKKKRDNRKLWVALPDRPVTAQRQYNLW